MFDGLIDGRLAGAIADTVPQEEITEIRMRVGRPLVVMTAKERRTVKRGGGMPYTVSRADVDRVLQIASDYSLYSVNDELVKGYIPFGGARVGVAGEAVGDGGKLLTLKNIGYLTIRIPHQIRGAADKIADKVFYGGKIKNTLIISPPGAGKTTMLRELARIASVKYNTLIIDERYEIASCARGSAELDVGDCDVMSGVAKSVAYESCIRSMNPEIIVTDELFRSAEIEAVTDIVRSGVKVFATVHGESSGSVRASRVFAPLLDCFELAVILSKTPSIGSVIGVEEL